MVKQTRHIRISKNGNPFEAGSKISTAQIGDGKLPNKYWVTISNDFYICKRGQCDWASEKLSFKVNSKTIAVFSTYQEARNYAENLIENMPDKPKKDTTNHIAIEDRLSGELFSDTLGAYPESEDDLLNGHRVDHEVHEDLSFTKQKIKEAGQEFR